MGHEESCDALLQHVFYFPLQPAALLQACQDVTLRQQVHVLPPHMCLPVSQTVYEFFFGFCILSDLVEYQLACFALFLLDAMQY